MRYIKNYQEELEVFRALGSEVRVDILSLLLKNGKMSMNDLAEALHISNGALTPHIRRLEICDLIRINADPAAHGNQKMCEPHLDKILFVFRRSQHPQNEYRGRLRVGQYSSCQVYPTCGISTSEAVIGIVDDPRFFFHEKHFDGDILWFSKGYVEYMIPCVIPLGSRIEQIQISAELSSEAPGNNAFWPSDIHFYLNHILLGTWTSPGDFADVKGLFTPDWWFPTWNQYGLLKTLTIRQDGTFIDDIRISQVTIQDLQLSTDSPILFRLSVPDQARHVGGLTIFGRGFGNYNQDIEFRILFQQ